MSRSCHTTPKAPNAGLSFREVSSQRRDRRVLPSSSQSPSAFPCINTGDRQGRGWMTEYPGTEDSQDPACRNLGSVLQRSSRRARAVPGVSVTQPPPRPSSRFPRRRSPVQIATHMSRLIYFCSGNRLIAVSYPTGAFLRLASGTSGLFSPTAASTPYVSMHMPTPSLAGSPDSTPMRTDQVFDWDSGRAGKNLKLESTVAAETALSCGFFDHPIRPQCPWPGPCGPFLRQTAHLSV